MNPIPESQCDTSEEGSAWSQNQAVAFVGQAFMDDEPVGEPVIFNFAYEFIEAEKNTELATGGNGCFVIKGSETRTESRHPELGIEGHYFTPIDPDGQPIGQIFYAYRSGRVDHWSAKTADGWKYADHPAKAIEFLLEQ